MTKRYIEDRFFRDETWKIHEIAKRRDRMERTGTSGSDSVLRRFGTRSNRADFWAPTGSEVDAKEASYSKVISSDLEPERKWL